MSDVRRTSKEIALELIQRGFIPIPLRGKVPALKDWTNQATDTPEYVERVFREGHGVGILTGRRGGIVVIDIDQGEDRGAAKRLKELVKEGWPKTFTAVTKSGGVHLYYRVPDAPIKTRAGWRPNVDVRAEGGQVVLYTLPDWDQIATLPPEFIAKLQGPATKAPTHDVRRTTSDDMDLGYAEAFELPQVILSGQRNEILSRYAWSLLARGAKAAEVERQVQEAARDNCRPPYPKDETDVLVAKALENWVRKAPQRDYGMEDEGAGEPGGSGADDEADDPLSRLQRRFVFVVQDNVVYDLAARKFLPLEGFRNANTQTYDTRPKGARRGSPMTLAATWLKHPRTVKVPYVDYEPGQGQVFERSGDNILNLWVPPALEPKKGDVGPFMEHLRFLFDGDKTSAQHFLHWLAFVVQNPGKRVGHACLIVGGQGTGKSVIATVLRRMLGDHNVCLVSNAILQSAYNEWMEHTQIAVAEEFRMSGRWNMMNELKALVSEDKVVINAKYRRPYNCDNHTNFLLFSNFDDAAHLEGDDRRYWVFVSKARKRDYDYYTRLWEWARGDGPAALLELLQRQDLTEFDRARWNPPATKSKQAMIEASRSDVVEWLDTALEDRNHPLASDLVTQTQVKDALRAEFGQQETPWARRWLRKNAVAMPVTGNPKDGRTIRLWAVRNAQQWEAATGPERVAEWEKGFSM